jgi:hypothetical protein
VIKGLSIAVKAPTNPRAGFHGQGGDAVSLNVEKPWLRRRLPLPDVHAGLYEQWDGVRRHVLGVGDDASIPGRVVVVFLTLSDDRAEGGMAVMSHAEFFAPVDPTTGRSFTKPTELERARMVARHRHLGSGS